MMLTSDFHQLVTAPTKDLMSLTHNLLQSPETVNCEIEEHLRGHFKKRSRMHYIDEFVYSKLALCKVTNLLLKKFGPLTSQTICDYLFNYSSGVKWEALCAEPKTECFTRKSWMIFAFIELR
jgi:hypothetical protein